MTLKKLSDNMLPRIETDLQRIIAKLDEPHARPFYDMLTYHMGWTGEGSGSEAQGKRIRPLLLLLTVSACGADWEPALPIASSLELIHNFSLIHDDIQDRADLRRGRPTVWKAWDLPQAINAGDALFILAQLAVFESEGNFSPKTLVAAGKLIQQACLSLSRGQFLDLSYEKRDELTVEDYWPMVAGKTASLLSVCTQAGALLARADEITQENYRDFGYHLGLAFQVQDDYLGIWGDAALTGKSVASDLLTGKKSLPVLFGLERKGAFAQRWTAGPIGDNEVAKLSVLLAEEGAQKFTQAKVDQMTKLALQFLHAANPQGEAGESLSELAQVLLGRQA